MRLKGLSTTAFMSAFDRLQRAGETTPGLTKWSSHGLTWTRGRHAYYGVEYSSTIEVVRVTSGGTKPWVLMMVREGWWDENGVDLIKTRQWAHLVKGDRAKALVELSRLIDELQ